MDRIKPEECVKRSPEGIWGPHPLPVTTQEGSLCQVGLDAKPRCVKISVTVWPTTSGSTQELL